MAGHGDTSRVLKRTRNEVGWYSIYSVDIRDSCDQVASGTLKELRRAVCDAKT